MKNVPGMSFVPLPFRILHFALCVFHCAAYAGAINTVDGKRYEGAIRLESTDTLSITPKTGQPVSIALDDVLLADFRAVETTPDVWSSRDIGQVAIPGAMRAQGATITIKGSGTGMGGGDRDELHFASQLLKGDGQIVARVVSVGQTDRLARAGLMFRATTDQASTYVAAAVLAGGEAVFSRRTRMGGETRAANFIAAAPVWLKLVRRGNNFLAYTSANGEDWDQVGSESVSMPQQVSVGLFVSAFKRDAASTAVFERVAVGPWKEEQPFRFRGLVLRDGNMLGCDIRSADDSVVRIWREREQDIAVPVLEVSRIVLETPSIGQWTMLNKPGRVGVLPKRGDFQEGSLAGIDGEVKLSTVLFGVRRFGRNDVIGVALRDVNPMPARYELRLSSGSRLAVDRIEWGKEYCAVELRTLGRVRIPHWDLAEIRAGASRFCPLNQLKPRNLRSVGPGSFLVNGTAAGATMSLGGQQVTHGIGLAAGASVSYNLGGDYRLLLARAGVPEGLMPSAAVRVVVLGDDKELYRSPVLTSLSQPVSLVLPVKGVNTLSLLVERAPGGLGGSAMLGEPSLIK